MSMFGNISDYQTDDSVENNGVVLSFGDGRAITIRRAGGSNVDFKNLFAKKYETLDKDIEGKVIDEDEASNVMFEVYAKAVVIDWEGFKDPEGKAIPFSISNCISLFKESEEIWLQVYNNAQKLSNFRTLKAEESGNE